MYLEVEQPESLYIDPLFARSRADSAGVGPVLTQTCLVANFPDPALYNITSSTNECIEHLKCSVVCCENFGEVVPKCRRKWLCFRESDERSVSVPSVIIERPGSLEIVQFNVNITDINTYDFLER